MRDYAVVTGAYWAFTLTDGALRMLVLLYFHDLGYSPVSLAFLFLLYELFGVFTNLVGGWLGARSGLHRTLVAGLALQVVALLGLSAHSSDWVEWKSVVWVMVAQALSGIAKDLTKLSSKSAVKLVVADGALFRFVAALTGSKNALKGVGFFLGAWLLAWRGFDEALWSMAAGLVVVLAAAAALLGGDLGRAATKPSLGSILAKSAAINRLSLARFFLFGARDIWFVVAVPVFLDEELDWSFEGIGGFLAAWVIGYGLVQSVAPQVLRAGAATGRTAQVLLVPLVAVTAAIAIAVSAERVVTAAVVGGLLAFGVVFALNSAVHSYLVLAYSATDDDVAMDVGFYYSANAAGRLVGTLLSGLLYLAAGLPGALWGACGFLVAAWLISTRLPRHGTASGIATTTEGIP